MLSFVARSDEEVSKVLRDEAAGSALEATFVQSLEAEGSPVADPSAVGALLAILIERARARWPGLAIDTAAFVRYLAARLPEGAPVLEALAATHVEDLYLAFGCASGDNGALLAFERTFLADIGAFVAGVERSPAFADEVRQSIRDKLFAGEDGELKIVEFTGRGALGGWLRVAAIRIALNLKRSEKRAAAASEKASVETALGRSPELAYLQEHYREAFAEALRAAIADLSDRDRALLRLYHADGLALEAMAALYRVHLSTVSRWLTSAREQVAEGTARHLRDRLGASGSDVDSIAALVMSQLDVSLTSLLGGSR